MGPEVMVGVFAGAGLLAVALTPLAASMARRIQLVSRPRDDRWQLRPTPLLGGAAMAGAALVTVALTSAPQTGTIIVACGLAAVALGLFDDFRRVAPTTKLVGQVLVASLLAMGGVKVEIIPVAPVAFLLTIFWVVAVMNALNLMDNMDGLAAGITVIAGITLMVTALPENPAAAAVAAATAGAALGFLVHNFPPAKIFMGDAGSQLLGFLLASSALLHTASGTTTASLALLAPLAALALPIFDTALVTASRRLAGLPVTRGGKDHSSHRLAALGLTERGAVLALYAVAAVFGVIGVLSDAASASVIPLIGLGAVGLVLFGVFLHEVDVYGRRPAAPAGESDSGRAAVLRGFSVYGRFGAEIALDAMLLTIAYFTAFLLRFEGIPDSSWMPQFVESVPIVVGAHLAGLVVTGVYRTVWRYLGISDAIAIVRALALGTAAASLAIFFVLRLPAYSRAIFVLDALIAAMLLIGARAFLVWLRHWFAGRPREGELRVLIVGATESGAFALRLLARSTTAAYRVIGYLDDDPGKRYRRVAGVPVVGTTAAVEDKIRLHRASLIVVAGGSADSATVERVRAACAAEGIEFRELLVV